MNFVRFRRPGVKLKVELTDEQQTILKSHKVRRKVVKATAPNGSVVRQRVPVKVYPMLGDLLQ